MRDPTKHEEPFTLNMPFGEAIERYSRATRLAEPTPDYDTGTAAPFVKWVGGKRSIIAELKARLPETFDGEYWEPFAGGAALFFEVADRLTAAHLSDNNLDLIIAY